MFKGKFVVLSLIAAALLCWQVLPADNANSGVVDPNNSTVGGGPGCLLVCPQGDGGNISDAGGPITIVAMDNVPAPIPGIPAADCWVDGCTNPLFLCGGSGSANADSATNSAGATTMSGQVAAGGYSPDLMVIVQGVIIGAPTCLAIVATSPDINADGLVDVIDLGLFAIGFTSPPKPYDVTLDYNCDGLVDIIDLSLFAQHWLHTC
jgi:hypothetical protein